MRQVHRPTLARISRVQARHDPASGATQTSLLPASHNGRRRRASSCGPRILTSGSRVGDRTPRCSRRRSRRPQIGREPTLERGCDPPHRTKRAGARRRSPVKRRARNASAPRYGRRNGTTGMRGPPRPRPSKPKAVTSSRHHGVPFGSLGSPADALVVYEQDPASPRSPAACRIAVVPNCAVSSRAAAGWRGLSAQSTQGNAASPNSTATSSYENLRQRTEARRCSSTLAITLGARSIASPAASMSVSRPSTPPVETDGRPSRSRRPAFPFPTTGYASVKAMRLTCGYGRLAGQRVFPVPVIAAFPMLLRANVPKLACPLR